MVVNWIVLFLGWLFGFGNLGLTLIWFLSWFDYLNFDSVGFIV